MSKSRKLSNNQRLARFFAKAKYNESGCLQYHAHKYSNYIQVRRSPPEYFKTQTTFLHRFVYAVWNDVPLTPEDVIMHTCDNRICINPNHLKLGTHKQNNWRNRPKA